MTTRDLAIRIIAAVTVTAAITAGLTACSPEEAPPVGVATVVGVRANSPAPDADAVKNAIPASLPAGSVLTLTGVSGDVAGVPGAAFTTLDAGEDTANEQQALGLRARIVEDLPTVAALVPEADVLSAVGTAAASIAHVPGDRLLIIADSMLSTSGVLDFTKGLLSQEPADVAAKVPADQLPKLDGDRVVIIGQGRTADPQLPLGVADRTTLRAIWEGVLMRAGAASIDYIDAVASGPAAQTTPAVTPVVPSPVEPVLFPSECAAVAPADTLTFLKGSATFDDEATARAAIADIVAHLKGCQGAVHIVGTTSSEGTASENEAIADSRAQAVAAILSAQTGIPVSDMDVRGVSTDFPEFVPDTDAEGTLIESLARKNRTVRISFGD